MKNFSGSLVRSRNWYALSVVAAAMSVSPMLLYMNPKYAYAIANCGSMAMAR